MRYRPGVTLDIGVEMMQSLAGALRMGAATGRMPARGRILRDPRPLRLFQFVALPFFTLPITVLAQAALEYGLTSAGGAVAASGGSAMIAGCSSLTCLNHSYPGTTILIMVAICLIIIRWLSGPARYRTR